MPKLKTHKGAAKRFRLTATGKIKRSTTLMFPRYHQWRAVKKLVDSVITFQERSLEIVGEMRRLSTQNSAEIRDAVEDGKRRIARLVAEGRALPAHG